MSGAVSDIGIPLRRLVAESLYQSAINALTSSLKAPLSDPKAFAALNEAFDFLEKLPLSLRRLAWLSTFGSPTHVRIIKRTLTEQLWSVGVNHGLFQRLGSPSSAVDCVAEAMAEPSGVGKLLAIVATSDQNDLRGVVAKLHNYSAFSVLCGDASSSTIAADAIHLVALKPTRPTLEALCAALGNDYSQSAAAVCAVALWISALMNPDSPQVSPPNHPTIPHLLAVSGHVAFVERARANSDCMMGSAPAKNSNQTKRSRLPSQFRDRFPWIGMRRKVYRIQRTRSSRRFSSSGLRAS